MFCLEDELRGITSVAIAGHVRPDGDCAGSCLALFNYIKENFSHIKADVYLEELPNAVQFLKHAEQIHHSFESARSYDLFFALDSGDKERLGGAAAIFDKASRTICIDHHISNCGYAQSNYILPEASSTCEMIFSVFSEEKISKDVAEALYTGIIHDTGVFQYTNTSPKTLQIAGTLIGKGIAFSKIIEESFYQKSYVQNQILGRALLESILLLNGKVIVSGIRKSEMEFYDVTSKDLDGIVSQLRLTKGVECAMFLYETAFHEYKVSLRSGDRVDVSKIASYFGGGGHVKAAGCTMNGTMHDVINNISIHIEKQL